jgi:hypothetical protein
MQHQIDVQKSVVKGNGYDRSKKNVAYLMEYVSSGEYTEYALVSFFYYFKLRYLACSDIKTLDKFLMSF